MPKVSVVIPVYNVEKYLNECIESILNQTYKDFEIILVDDGSIDKSGEICDDYANKYDCITVIHQDNQGQAAARNNGVKLAGTDWIVFIDSDDVVHTQLLEYLYRAVVDTCSPIGVCSRVKGADIPDDFFQEQEFYCEPEEINENKLSEYYKNDDNVYWALFPSIIRKDIIVNRPFTNGRIYEDNAISCQWLCDAERIVRVPSILYFYRNNPTGTMNQPFSIKKLDYLWALEEQIKFYDKLCYENMLNVIGQSYFGTAVYFYDLICENTNDESIKKELRLQIKRVQKTYHSRITISDNVKQKLYKIMKPKTYRLKKIFKHILSLIK